MKRVITAIAIMGLAACGGDEATTPTSTGGGSLVVEDLVVGSGATAAVGNTVSVHYIGTFTNGTKFDSSYDRGQPLPPFRLGSGAVIPGFEQGIVGMRVGGKRRLTIPPSLAYGSSGQGPIPPNSTLVFEVELLAILS